jgi:hypothetical protein
MYNFVLKCIGKYIVFKFDDGQILECLKPRSDKILWQLSREALDPLLGALQPGAADPYQPDSALEQLQAVFKREPSVFKSCNYALQVL